MQVRGAIHSGKENSVAPRSRLRDPLELVTAYALILVVIWTPRPLQRYLWWLAAAGVLVIAVRSFEGFAALGLRTTNFLRSSWVVGAALLVNAIAVFVATKFNTLHLPPGGVVGFLKNYWAYSLWALVQQYLLQGFFLTRFLRLLKGPKAAALAAALAFSIAHLPSPLLTSVTLIWGFAACLLFLRYRNLYSLALAHAILGITISMTVPGPIDHNMRVGLGYLTYHRHTRNPPRSPQP